MKEIWLWQNLHWLQFSIPPCIQSFCSWDFVISHWWWNLLLCSSDGGLDHENHFDHRHLWGKCSVQPWCLTSRDWSHVSSCFSWASSIQVRILSMPWCPGLSLASSNPPLNGPESIINMGQTWAQTAA